MRMIQFPHVVCSRFVVFILICGSFAEGTNAQINQESSAPFTSVCLTQTGQLISGSDFGLRTHDLETLKPTKLLDSEIEKHYSITASPDGSKIAVSGGTPSESGVVEVFSVPSMELVKRFVGFDDVATDVGWRSEDQLIAASMTGNCRLFDLENKNSAGKNLSFNVHSQPILAIGLLENQEIISAGKDNSIRVWKFDSPNKARILNNHIDVVSDIAVQPSQSKDNGNKAPMIASVSHDGTARFWQPTIGRMIRFARLDSVPSCVTWRRDGSAAIVGCRDGSILLLDPQTAKQVSKSKSEGWIFDMTLSNDGNSVIVATENGLRRVKLVTNHAAK